MTYIFKSAIPTLAVGIRIRYNINCVGVQEMLCLSASRFISADSRRREGFIDCFYV